MSWSTAVVYTLPNEEILEYFKNIDSLKNRIFEVANLDGIRSEWTKDIFRSDKVQKHSLPDIGLLAIEPNIFMTGYDRGEDDTFFIENSRDEKKSIITREA